MRLPWHLGQNSSFFHYTILCNIILFKTPPDFGLRLKELREGKNLSQADVARIIEISRTTISGYEQNIKTPKIETLKKLALLYNSSVDYILGIETRKNFYLDDFTPEQQDIVLDFLEKIKPQMKKTGD